MPLYLSLLALALPAQAVTGTVLPAVPSVPPGTIAEPPGDPLAEARTRYAQSDPSGAVAVLAPYVQSRQSRGTDRAPARMLLGTAHLDLGNANLASEQFYQLRKAEGSLAEIGAWWEAVADLQRGRPKSTINECSAYRDTYPEGIYAQECRVLIGDAQAASGNYGAAGSAYRAYLADPANAGQKREDEMRLRVARAVTRSNPERGISLLQQLAVHHSYASTGMGAMRALDDLRDAGHADAVVPSDPQSRMALANSFRQSGWAKAAWVAFEALEADAAENPEIDRWVASNHSRFVRSTRHWDRPAADLVAAYRMGEESGGATPEMAWQIFDLWSRAGRWDKAVKWGRLGLDVHSESRASRNRLDDVARAEMLAGEWAESHKRWSDARSAGHGRRANSLFYGGLTAYLAGEHEAAEANLTDTIAKSKYWRIAAYYWRSKSRAALGDTEGAEDDRETVRSIDPTGWYALWLDPHEPEGSDWVRRDGTWQGVVPPELPAFTAPAIQAASSVGQWPAATPVVDLGGTSRAGRMTPTTATGWATLSWPLTPAELTPQTATAPPLAGIHTDIPDSYVEGEFFEPETGLRNLSAIARNHGEIWPHLPAAVPLIRAGLYNQASPLVNAAYAEFRDPTTVADPERRKAISELKDTLKGWKGAVQAARDYHHTVLHFWGVHHRMDPGEARDQVLRFQYPIAYGRELWEHCQRWNVDPFLVLAVMRQESVYNANAMSPTGAMGLVQFLKGTGSKVSAMLEEPLYSPHDLFDPSINLRYAVFYLKILSERFGGNFPVAVASYNGGPHNMSRHHRELIGKLPLDAFVEMIERREPRDYVKRVTGYYQLYADLYGPPGARVVLPAKVTEDDPNIVDF